MRNEEEAGGGALPAGSTGSIVAFWPLARFGSTLGVGRFALAVTEPGGVVATQWRTKVVCER
jgi:hypothetical protein